MLCDFVGPQFTVRFQGSDLTYALPNMIVDLDELLFVISARVTRFYIFWIDTQLIKSNLKE